MKKSREISFFLTYILFLFFYICDIQKLKAFSLKNEKAKAKTTSTSGGIHKPSYNPGGDEFENDKEFFQVYQKKYHNLNFSDNLAENSNNFERNICAEENSLIPGGKFIENIDIELLNRKELLDISSKKYYCVQNLDIPSELLFLVESQCEQEIHEKQPSIYSNKNIMNEISNHEIKATTKLKSLDKNYNCKESNKNEFSYDQNFENISFAKNDSENILEENEKFDELAFEEEIPLIKFKE